MRTDWPPLDDSAAEDDGPPLRPRPTRITPRCLYELLVEHFVDDREDWTPERRALEFLRAFPGLTFHIPPRDVVERIAREQHIAKRLTKDPSTENVRRLSQFHSMPMRGVVKEFQKTTGKTVLSLRPPPPTKPPEAPPDSAAPPEPRYPIRREVLSRNLTSAR